MDSARPAIRESFIDRRHFVLRRLHSLSGIVPVGTFLIEHLFTNAAILLGGEHYQKDIDFIWGLPGLLILEIFGIWLPIAFHAALGLVYTFSGEHNSTTYRYAGNHRYTLMRITGIIALIFIFFHIATTRWHWDIFGWYTPFDPERATVTTAEAVQFSWWVVWFYLVGMLAVVFHFANGLWTAAITWGLTISETAMRRWGYVCATIGVVLAVVGVASLWQFSVYPLKG